MSIFFVGPGKSYSSLCKWRLILGSHTLTWANSDLGGASCKARFLSSLNHSGACFGVQTITLLVIKHSSRREIHAVYGWLTRGEEI